MQDAPLENWEEATFDDMTRQIDTMEAERDDLQREVDACHAIMKKVREIWGSDTLTIDAAQGVQDRISELETLLERIRDLQMADGASLGWAQKIAYEALGGDA